MTKRSRGLLSRSILLAIAVLLVWNPQQQQQQQQQQQRNEERNGQPRLRLWLPQRLRLLPPIFAAVDGFPISVSHSTSTRRHRKSPLSVVSLRSSSKDSQQLDRDRNGGNASPLLIIGIGIATAVLLGTGLSSPAIANANDHLLDGSSSASLSSFSSSSSSSVTRSSGQPPPAMEISDLVKSLRPATEGRPQIPFPTNQALQRAAEQAQSDSSAASSAAISNPFATRPIPQENLLRENPYSLPALINLESPRNRPYNGADILVLQVWTDRPGSAAAASSTTPNENLLPKIIGGAKIPIGAVKGGFPVRVSLGPQNALSSANANPGANDEASLQEWKDYLSSQSLWVRAAVCREGSDSSSSSSSSTTAACPSNYPTPLLEGIGFSKWIDLSTIERAVTSKDTAGGTLQPARSQTASSSGGGGLRAPVSLVLSLPQGPTK